MDFFDKVSDAIQNKGQEVADKARDLAEIATLKSQIGTCEEVVRKKFMEIGKLYYEKYGEDESCEFDEQCRAVKNARGGIEALEKKIGEIKGI